MKYLFSKQFNAWIDEKDPISFGPCFDGVAIKAGSLLGSGFEPYHLRGLTLPEEINGVPVTELNGTYPQDEVGYIEATQLKRINIELIVEKNFYGEERCCYPVLCGGAQNTIQSMRITFTGDKMHVNRIEDPAVRAAVEYIDFGGRVIDDADWDYGSFQSGLFSGSVKLNAVRGYFEGYCLTGGTFAGCTSLVSPPNISVKYMGDREFQDCFALPRIHLHDGLNGIGSKCFKNCRSLTDVYIPDTVERIGSGAFDGCLRLGTIHFPKAVTHISDRLFAGCEALQKVFLPDGIQSIGDEAFIGCASLKRPWFPRGLTCIGEKAFYGCVSMGEIYLPETLDSIGPNAFSNCDQLVIHGKPGTLAEQYAREHQMQFAAD